MTNKKTLNDTVTEALNLERHSPVTEEARRVMNLAGDAVRLVKIDNDVLRNLVSEILQDYRNDSDAGVLRGILNKILGIFGQRLVSRKGVSGLVLDIVSDDTVQTSIISVDTESLRRIFHDIAAEVNGLGDINTRNEAKLHEMESHLSTAVRDAENAKNRLSAEQSENARRETETFRYIQRMLAERGKDNPPDEDEALGQLLDVLGITFSWEPAREPSAFQTYIISDESKAGVSLPCLLKNDDIAVKGLVYAVNPGKTE